MTLNALILAGGFGTRLWPSSRERLPKHFLALTDGLSLLRETYLRIAPILEPDRIYVVTGAQYVEQVNAHLPELPAENVIVEPAARGTAPAIGLAILHMQRRHGDSVMVSLHADHVIQDAEGFRRRVLLAAALAEKGHIVTLGVTPDSADTGLGYIERGDPLGDPDVADAYGVLRFTEKPDAKRAQEFVASGRFYWNSGIFVWKQSRLMEEVRNLLPDLDAALQRIDGAIGEDDERRVLEGTWAGVQSVTIDVGVMEKARNVAVVPLSVGWSDVGSWKAVSELRPSDADGNVVVGEHVGLDTSGTLIWGKDRLVATVGLKDMVVVDTDDVVLICPKDRAQDVKALVERLRKEHKSQYA